MKNSSIVLILLVFIFAFIVYEVVKDNDNYLLKKSIQKISLVRENIEKETNVYDEYQTCRIDKPCSIDDLKQRQHQNKEPENTEEKNKENDNDGIFVDGGKYNKPEYTEMFLFRGPFWF